MPCSTNICRSHSLRRWTLLSSVLVRSCRCCHRIVAQPSGSRQASCRPLEMWLKAKGVRVLCAGTGGGAGVPAAHTGAQAPQGPGGRGAGQAHAALPQQLLQRGASGNTRTCLCCDPRPAECQSDFRRMQNVQRLLLHSTASSHRFFPTHIWHVLSEHNLDWIRQPGQCLWA